MLIWYYFLTYKSRSFLTINLSTLNLSVPYLYTDSPFLNFNTIKYWSLWLSASVKDRTSGKLECHLLLHGQPDWVFPSREVQVNLWMFQHGNFIVVTARFFDVAKFTTLTPLSLLLSRKFSFPALGWKNFLVPPFCIKMSQQNFQKVNRKKKTGSYSSYNLSWSYHRFPQLGMFIRNSGITPVTSQHYIWYPTSNKPYSSNWWYYSLLYKNLVPNWLFSFPFHRTTYNPSLLERLLCPT